MSHESMEFPHSLAAQINEEMANEFGGDARAFSLQLESLVCKMYQSALAQGAPENDAQAAISDFLDEAKDIGLDAFMNAKEVAETDDSMSDGDDDDAARDAERRLRSRYTLMAAAMRLRKDNWCEHAWSRTHNGYMEDLEIFHTIAFWDLMNEVRRAKAEDSEGGMDVNQ